MTAVAAASLQEAAAPAAADAASPPAAAAAPLPRSAETADAARRKVSFEKRLPVFLLSFPPVFLSLSLFCVSHPSFPSSSNRSLSNL